MKSFQVAILGNGRVAQAAAYYFKKQDYIKKVYLDSSNAEIKGCHLLVGALAGGIGERALELALRYKKNLIDISDIDPPFYLKSERKIQSRGITVIPGCGFSPGIVNFILGKELFSLGSAREIEIKAGSLAKKKSFFPFLWCFEDLILEHQIPSWQVIEGKKRKFPHFSGYQKEKYFGIEAESYFCASGFENILEAVKLDNFTCRVVRPSGFREFFSFLKNQGFLKKDTLAFTKKILESIREDNYTLGQIVISWKNKKIAWLMKSFSRKTENINSMQKITAAVPVIMGGLLLKGALKSRGLLFMEELGKDELVFKELIKQIRLCGLRIERRAG